MAQPSSASSSNAVPTPAARAQQGIRSGMVRSAIVIAGVAACVGVSIPAVGFLTSPRGIAGPTMMDATNPVTAAIAVALTMAVCTGIACVVGRLINAAVGMFVLGCGCAFITMQCGSAYDAAFDNDSLPRIAVETLAWAGLVAVMSAIVFRASGPLPDIPALDPKGRYLGEVVNSDALRGVLSGLVGVAVVWLLMRNDLKGQAVGSAVFAGVATALAGRRLQGAAQPILLMASPVLFIGLAQVWTAMTKGGPFDLLLSTNALPGWSRMMPMDVAAGAMVGVPIGLGWSRSTAEE